MLDLEIEKHFQCPLSFGTAGIRGKMGVQVGCFNTYVIQKISQGIANYINNEKNSGANFSAVAIAYDTRLNSKKFAHMAASVFAGNNIKVYMFSSYAPTPLLSFVIKALSLTAGIVITASHNPPEYNGYKVYWKNGAQVVSPHDTGIIKEINLINSSKSIQHLDFTTACQNKSIIYVPVSLCSEYANQTTAHSFGEPKYNKQFDLIYTPIYGTGKEYVPKILLDRKFVNVTMVEKEAMQICDATVTPKALNPEDEFCYNEALAIAKPKDQIIIATDPDADRLGIMVKYCGKWCKLSGNEVGILLLDYFLTHLEKTNGTSINGYLLTTVVSSLLVKKMAIAFNLKYIETMVGFRYMANKMAELPDYDKELFVFAMEESGGYLFGHLVKDKDAISAAMHFAELSASLYANNRTPVDRLKEIYDIYGYCEDFTFSYVFPSEHKEKYVNLVKLLDAPSLKQIGNHKLAYTISYVSGVIWDHINNVTKSLEPQESVYTIGFYLVNGCRITIRLSGTEPKIKYYFNLISESKSEIELLKKDLIASLKDCLTTNYPLIKNLW